MSQRLSLLWAVWDLMCAHRKVWEVCTACDWLDGLAALTEGPCIIPQDYRPGVTRAQLEDEQRRQRIRDGLEPETSGAAQGKGGPEFNDGSFARSGEPSPFLLKICYAFPECTPHRPSFLDD